MRPARKALAAAAAFGLLLASAPSAAEDPLSLQELRRRRAELEVLPPSRSRLDLSGSTSELEMAAAVLLRLYQLVLSSQDGPRCMFTPSCSEYARLAIRRHGLAAGALMAADRYQRCNGLSPEQYPLDPRTGKRLDPPPPRPGVPGLP